MEIREKDPSEVLLERKLLSSFVEFTDESEKPNSRYLFLKDKAKEMIDYHMNSDNSNKRQLNQLEIQGLKNSLFGSEASSPKLSSSLRKHVTKKKQKLKLQVHELYQTEISGQAEFLKIKDMMMKQNGNLENTIQNLKILKKPLKAIKATLNKDHIAEQTLEIEELSANIVSDLENQMIVFHDIIRLTESLGKICLFEKNELRRMLNEEMDTRLIKAKQKYENQLKAVIEHNKELSKSVKGKISEDEHYEEVSQLKDAITDLNKAYNDSLEITKRKSNDINKLQTTIVKQTEEIGRLYNDLSNFQSIIKSQQTIEDSQTVNLKAEIEYLNDMLAQASKELEISRQTESGKIAQIEVTKDREIERLKTDVKLLENQLQDSIYHSRSDDGLNKRVIHELKTEIQNYQDELKVLNHQFREEIAGMHIAIAEKEKQMCLERERLLSEIDSKEQIKIKHKNEWGDIYEGLTREIKKLKSETNQLFLDNQKLVAELNRNQDTQAEGQVSFKHQQESYRVRLKEREMELRKFWEIIKELQQLYNSKGKIDFNDIRSLLNIKGLSSNKSRKS